MNEVATIGIDFGTTQSCVAVFRNEKVEIIANDEGKRLTPSYVAFKGKERLAGESAKIQSEINPSNAIFNVKQIMGRKFDEIMQDSGYEVPFPIINRERYPKIKVLCGNDEKEFYPEQISSMILMRMKETAETYLEKEVNSAVISIPACFNDSQRQATKDAAHIAGFGMVRLINEPTAAALTFGFHTKPDNERNLLIFDFGGGKLDVSLIIINKDSFQVKATIGNSRLGGENFDNCLVSHYAKKLQEQHDYDIMSNSNKRSWRRLKDACEKAKRTLSASVTSFIEIDCLFNGIDFIRTLTRPEFEKINEDLLNSIIQPVKELLEIVEIQKSNIDDVVLVGGSTRIPKVQELLQQFFDGKPLNRSINPDEAIAYGAAVQAAILDSYSPNNLKYITIKDVISFSLSTREKNENAKKLIKRYTPIPTEKKKWCRFESLENDVHIEVFEGESEFSKENNFLGLFKLLNVGSYYKKNIQVQIEVDADGIAKLTAFDGRTQNKSEFISHKRCLNQDKIIELIEETKQYRSEELKRHHVIEAKDNLENYCHEVESKLNSSNKLSKSSKIIISHRLHVMAICCDDCGNDKDDSFYANNKSELEECFEDYLKIYDDIE